MHLHITALIAVPTVSVPKYLIFAKHILGANWIKPTAAHLINKKNT